MLSINSLSVGFVLWLLPDRFAIDRVSDLILPPFYVSTISRLLVSQKFPCFQEVPEKTKESPGGPWQFIGLLSLFDPPRHDSAETIRRALNLGVNVKMITGKFMIINLLSFQVMLTLCSWLIYFHVMFKF